VRCILKSLIVLSVVGSLLTIKVYSSRGIQKEGEMKLGGHLFKVLAQSVKLLLAG